MSPVRVWDFLHGRARDEKAKEFYKKLSFENSEYDLEKEFYSLFVDLLKARAKVLKMGEAMIIHEFETIHTTWNGCLVI